MDTSMHGCTLNNSTTNSEQLIINKFKSKTLFQHEILLNENIIVSMHAKLNQVYCSIA